MNDVIVKNQLGYAKGNKVKRYTRKHLRLLLNRDKMKQEDAERARKRLAQWLQRNHPAD